MVRKRNRIFIWMLLCFGTLQAQYRDDAGLWFKAAIEKKISRKFSGTLSTAARFNENISQLQTYFFAIGGEYKPRKWVNIEVTYRHSGKRDVESYYYQRDRINADLELKKKYFKSIIIKPRLRYQRQYSSLNTSEMGIVPNNYLRTKLKVAWDLKKKYQPFISSEMFYQIKYNKQGFNRVRYVLGVAYDLNKHHKVTAYLIHQREFNRFEPVRSYILGFSYKFTI